MGKRETPERRILLLLAHPDDETFGPGGTVAKYASEGAKVYLATATRGEEGMLGDPPLCGRERLGEVREGELRAAAAVLGLAEVTFLGFRDRTLAAVPAERLVGKAVGEIRRVRPHVIVGFGPEGVSGHPDHKAMSAAAGEAFDAAADPSRFPGTFRPWAAAKLYHFEVAQEILDAWNAPLFGVPRARLTTFIDTSGYAERRIEAFRCHRTQARDSARILSARDFRRFAEEETYVLAKSRVPAAGLPERDLFDGIPEEEEGSQG